MIQTEPQIRLVMSSTSRCLAAVDEAIARVKAALDGEPGDCLEINSHAEQEASVILLAGHRLCDELLAREAELRARMA